MVPVIILFFPSKWSEKIITYPFNLIVSVLSGPDQFVVTNLLVSVAFDDNPYEFHSNIATYRVG